MESRNHHSQRIDAQRGVVGAAQRSEECYGLSGSFPFLPLTPPYSQLSRHHSRFPRRPKSRSALDPFIDSRGVVYTQCTALRRAPVSRSRRQGPERERKWEREPFDCPLLLPDRRADELYRRRLPSGPLFRQGLRESMHQEPCHGIDVIRELRPARQ
jgi:hypothetical protein